MRILSFLFHLRRDIIKRAAECAFHHVLLNFCGPSEIAKLNSVVKANHNILRLDISMDYMLAMHILNSIHCLTDDSTDKLFSLLQIFLIH